jgi:predicted dehydrogenase
MATKLSECDRIMDAVKSACVKLQIGFDSRFNLVYMKAKKMLEKGDIGKPVMFRANRRSPTIWWRPPKKMPDFWLWDWEKGGGPIIEQCIHEIDLSRWFFSSEASRVYCELGSLVRNLKCGDNAAFVIRYRNGGIAAIDTSFSLPSGHPFDVRLEIIGSEGIIEVDLLNSNLTVSTSSPRKERRPIPLLLGSGGPWLGSWEAECHLNELRHFIKCIKEDKKPKVTGLDGKKALEIALAAVKSGLAKKPIELPLNEKPHN